MSINPANITTVRVGELPSAAFSLTDKIPHEVGVDLKSGTIGDLINYMAPLIGAMQYEVKTFHVNSLFITNNFDGTGLGTNLMLGFAICNGNNGTLNKDGKVGIAYGSTHNVIGQTGGSKDAVLVQHSHTLIAPFINTENLPGTALTNSNYIALGKSNDGELKYQLVPYPSAVLPTVGKSSVEGVSGTDKNMQPYIVELHVMKL